MNITHATVELHRRSLPPPRRGTVPQRILRRGLRGSTVCWSQANANRSLAPYTGCNTTSGVPVDFIPFGAIERPDGTIAWPPEYAEVMGVLGFAEARANAIEVRLPDNQILHVVALPMLAVLKLFAWVERRFREPRKDSADLFDILTKYLDAGQDERLYREAEHS